MRAALLLLVQLTHGAPERQFIRHLLLVRASLLHLQNAMSSSPLHACMLSQRLFQQQRGAHIQVGQRWARPQSLWP